MKRKDRCAAIVTIHRAAEMHPEGRKWVANWLRRHARRLEKHGANYTKRFVGRYLY